MMKKKVPIAQNQWRSAREAWWNRRRSVTESWGQKYQWEAEFNCDTMTYFLWPQCHNFGWTDNASNFGSQYPVVGKFLGRILLRSQRLDRRSGQNLSGQNYKATSDVDIGPSNIGIRSSRILSDTSD
jgi:hypothetical protein